LREKAKRIFQILFVVSMIIFGIGGRFLPTPLGFFTVSGFSMYPTLKPGDLVIGVGTYISPYNEGDVVIYCRNVSTCIVHRLMLVNNTYAITKGDYNPSNDPPISVDSIRFKVVGSVPLLIWLPLAVASLIFIFFPINPGKGFKQPFVLETFVYLFLLLVNLAYLTIYVLQTPPALTRIPLPTVGLATLATEKGYSTIIIDYRLTGLSIRGVEECLLIAQALTAHCSRYSVSGNRVLVYPPADFYKQLYDSNLSAFIVKLTLSLDQGTLVGSYPFVLEWKKPVLVIVNDKLVLSNPNPVPIEVIGYKIRSYVRNTRTLHVDEVLEYSSSGFTLQPFETREIDLAWILSTSYVEVRYIFMNQTFTWVGRLDK